MNPHRTPGIPGDHGAPVLRTYPPNPLVRNVIGRRLKGSPRNPMTYTGECIACGARLPVWGLAFNPVLLLNPNGSAHASTCPARVTVVRWVERPSGDAAVLVRVRGEVTPKLVEAARETTARIVAARPKKGQP